MECMDPVLTTPRLTVAGDLAGYNLIDKSAMYPDPYVWHLFVQFQYKLHYFFVYILFQMPFMQL